MMTGWLSTAERASGNHRNAKREPAWMESKNKGSWKNINQSSSEEFSINFLPTTNYTRKDFNSFQIFYFLLRHNFQFPAVCAMVYSLDEFFVRPPTPFISALIESRELLDSIHSHEISTLQMPSTAADRESICAGSKFRQFIKKTWEIDQLDRTQLPPSTLAI